MHPVIRFTAQVSAHSEMSSRGKIEFTSIVACKIIFNACKFHKASQNCQGVVERQKVLEPTRNDEDALVATALQEIVFDVVKPQVSNAMGGILDFFGETV